MTMFVGLLRRARGVSAEKSEGKEGVVSSLRARSSFPILLVGILMLMFDGYDLTSIGVVAPAMQLYEAWHVTPSLVGFIGSLAAFGMVPGGIVAGYCADRFGPRLAVTVSLCWVSLCMFATFMAPSLSSFMVARFLTGMGMGSLIPLAVALVSNCAPKERHSFYVAVTLSGLAVGSMVAVAVGKTILASFHFQWVFAVGVLPMLFVPVIWRLLSPESMSSRISHPASAPSSTVSHQAAQLGTLPPNRFRQLFIGRFGWATVGFALANLIVLLLFFAASTWLPSLLQRSGYALDTSLYFTISFFIGAFVGTLVIGVVADKTSLKWATVMTFVATFFALLVLSKPQSTAITVTMLAIAGLGSTGTGTLINAFVAKLYPVHLRGTALGVINSIGRVGAIVGPTYIGFVVAFDNSPRVGFLALMLPALIGAILVAVMPNQQRNIDVYHDGGRT